MNAVVMGKFLRKVFKSEELQGPRLPQLPINKKQEDHVQPICHQALIIKCYLGSSAPGARHKTFGMPRWGLQVWGSNQITWLLVPCHGLGHFPRGPFFQLIQELQRANTAARTSFCGTHRWPKMTRWVFLGQWK